MNHYDQLSLNTCHYSINNNFINYYYYLNNKFNRLMYDNEAQLSHFTCLWVTVFTGWTNAAGSVEASNKIIVILS